MKETIFRYAKSIRVRIISAFLAVLIIFAGLPYVGVVANAEETPTGEGGLANYVPPEKPAKEEKPSFFGKLFRR